MTALFLLVMNLQASPVEPFACSDREQASPPVTAHPIVMSKILLPTELDTAMSPRPLRATMTLVMRSGMEVPAARIVKPMISSEMPIVSPTCRNTLRSEGGAVSFEGVEYSLTKNTGGYKHGEKGNTETVSFTF